MDNFLNNLFPTPDASFLFLQNKSDEKAEEFRKSGNIKYQQNELVHALLDYNKSIAFAKSKKVVALGLANRSAVYFELKRYEECLKNINWALQNDYPVEKAANLKERKEKCEKLLQTTEKRENLWDFFKLSYPPNKKIPWLADCVTVRSSIQYGFGVFATRDLKAGDIICIEEPIIPLLVGDICYERCYNCTKSVFMNLLPCSKTASIMFCSTNCKNKLYSKTVDMNNIHSAEMRGLSELVNLAGGKKKLEDIIRGTNWNNLKMKKTIFDFDWNNTNDPNYNKNVLMCCLSSQKNNPIINAANINRNLFAMAPDVSANIVGVLIGNHLYFHENLEYCPLNPLSKIYHPITLFANLINHSCEPNALTFPADNKIVTVVLRPIKKFEQIFLSHECVKSYHSITKECQICSTDPEQIIDQVPMILIHQSNFTVLKAWIEDALKAINNSKAKQKDWERYLATFQLVFKILGLLCSRPFKYGLN